ncbi:hypothetical protein ABD76_04665 [Paenibacillus dendritiformis]|uniref:ABC-2 transporter permease n=1 Tax=Paenibacillus dendritiformis TaxID=130049 RepID=UPI0018CD5B31|nr:ABC-2 transporter permease [Paenibacillus dendritiformis]MBG9791829.1 hypothetical protein [Paenibacillus dendritiformis]
MLLHLVKKDFLLAKKHLAFMLAVAFVLPVFISSKLPVAGSFLAFFISWLYFVYLLFNTVSMMEYKYKGAALLCATPYTRQALVKAKYLFIGILFAACFLIYTIAALILPSNLELLSAASFAGSFLLFSLIFGILLPFQYHFGYEKSKYVFMIFVFLTPFVSPVIVRAAHDSRFSLGLNLPLPPAVQAWLPALLGLLIGWMSMRLSLAIYSRQNL